MSYPVPSSLATLGTLARITWKRTFRRKAVWAAVAFAVLPKVFASGLRGHGSPDDVLVVGRLLLAIIPPLFVAAAIGEEIEDRTATYLWSRPLARWTVVVGLLVALVPIVVAIMAFSWALVSLTSFDGTLLVKGTLSLAAGGFAISITSAAIATLVPKHGMALSIIYVLADLVLGALPTSLANLCITHHVKGVAMGDDLVESAIGLAAISAIWLVIGLRRIRRLEV